MPTKNSSRRSASRSPRPGDPFPDQSYLAYVRPAPLPFLRFTSGHFPAGTVTVPHAHACIALHGCLQGPLVLVTDDAEHALEAGVFFVIAPGIRHSWRNDGKHTAATLGLLIDASRPGRWPAGAGVEAGCRRLGQLVTGTHRFVAARDRELQYSFWLAADHLTAEESRGPMAIAGNLLCLMGQVCDRLEGPANAVPAELDLAQRIRRLLLARVSERLSISQIARETDSSPTRAKEAFRRAFGCGIISYFNQLKIWQAKRWLSDPSLTVDVVSDRLGFANAGYFSRVFQQQTGETPTEFRRQLRR